MMSARTFSIFISKAFDEVYTFAQEPQNFAKWAEGFGSGLHPRPDGTWVAEGPMGHIEVSFSVPNGYGVLDHTVYLPTGPISTPLRLVPNGLGCELILTLFRKADMSDEAYARDMKMVMEDLNRFKRLMEVDCEAVIHVDFQQRRK